MTENERLRDSGLFWMLVVVGAIPLVGLAILGHWDHVSLGLATWMVLVGVWALARHRRRRGDTARDESTGKDR